MFRTKVRFNLCVLLICWAAIVIPASAQHFQQITGSLTKVAVGRAEVWGINGSQIYRLNPGTKSFGQIPGSFTQVAVGGGTLLQRDEVWALNGYIYRFNFNTKAFAYVPGIRLGGVLPGLRFSQIVVGEGDADNCHPYEVWGIDPGTATIGGPSPVPTLYRYNYCTSLFDNIPTPNPFTVIATGGGDVWGLDEYAQIWHYNFQLAAWTQATGGYSGTLQQIAVGVNDVWGLDGNGTVYRYDPTSNQFNVVQTPAATAATTTQIAAGGDGVWEIYIYGLGLPNIIPQVLEGRFNSQIEAFLNVPGPTQFRCTATGCGQYIVPLAQIAVGYGGGVWGVTPTGQVWAVVRP